MDSLQRECWNCRTLTTPFHRSRYGDGLKWFAQYKCVPCQVGWTQWIDLEE